MEAVVDAAGRLVVPKAIRDALGLSSGTKVDVSLYGAGIQIVAAGRTARLIPEDDRLVAESETCISDDEIFGLLDSIRR